MALAEIFQRAAAIWIAMSSSFQRFLRLYAAFQSAGMRRTSALAARIRVSKSHWLTGRSSVIEGLKC
jgi:hypothetical protein